MANLLIGSSNIYRFHKFVTRKEQKPYTLICCTNLEVWNTTIDDIKVEKGDVIISVVENLICDAVVEVVDPEARKIVIEDVVGSFLAQVKKCAIERPGLKFAMVRPMLRPKHQWYMEEYENICKYFGETIKEMRIGNVARVEGTPGCTQVFTSDGVHLTEASGKVFVETLIQNSEIFFNQEIIDLVDDGKMDSSKLAKRIESVEKDIYRLRNELVERRLQDSLVTARIREEIDFMANAKKEDRLIITGLTSKTPMPTQSEEKKKWLNGIVGEILEKIEIGASKHILFASLASKNQRFIPLVEVKLDNRDLAVKIRKQFSAKKREIDFGKIFIANSVTLGTRVRVDILKSIAELYSNEKESMSVSAFVSRPVLHVRSKEGGIRMGTFNFSDALARYGANLTEKNLTEAYKRAGSAFKGQLQQNFVVLTERGLVNAMAGPSGGDVIARGKRLREDGRPEAQLGTPKKQAKTQN